MASFGTKIVKVNQRQKWWQSSLGNGPKFVDHQCSFGGNNSEIEEDEIVY